MFSKAKISNDNYLLPVPIILQAQINIAQKSQEARHLTAVGSSLARVTCEASQVLLAGGQVFFLGDLPFSPHLTIYSPPSPPPPRAPQKKKQQTKLSHSACGCSGGFSRRSSVFAPPNDLPGSKLVK